MYNMDNAIEMKNLNMETLLKGQYLKEIPKCPENGTYTSIGNLFSDDGKITCSVHGSNE